MPLLSSLDLFSGIGGITFALHGIAKPAAYCEIDRDCHTVLNWHMKHGNLPKAPIFDDVKKLTKKDLGDKKIDLIVGGWPCQDLSSMGLRKGLEGSRSGLIYEVLRLVDELQPSLLLLENVQQVLTSKDGQDFDDIIYEFTKKRNYQLRWAVIPASALGAHHQRKRWFGLFIKETALPKLYKMNWKMLGYDRASWAREPQRMIIPKNTVQKKHHIQYMAMLGNSVVPDAVRAAFILLASAFAHVPSKSVLKGLDSLRILPLPDFASASSTYPTWGCVANGQVYKVKAPKLHKPRLNLVFDPKVYTHPAVGKVTSPLVKKPVTWRLWSTPRHTVPFSHVLTERTMRDMPTQVRFERSTPQHLRNGIVSSRFVEWLMGYTGNRTFKGELYKP